MARVVMHRRKFKRQIVLPENCREWQQETAYVGAQAIRAAAPKETGFLTTRIAGYPQRDGSVRFRADVGDPPYGLFQEVGTGLYGPMKKWITPKRAKALSWLEGPNQRVFAARVRGSKPKRYFRLGFYATFGKRRVTYYGTTGGIGPQRG